MKGRLSVTREDARRRRWSPERRVFSDACQKLLAASGSSVADLLRAAPGLKRSTVYGVLNGATATGADDVLGMLFQQTGASREERQRIHVLRTRLATSAHRPDLPWPAAPHGDATSLRRLAQTEAAGIVVLDEQMSQLMLRRFDGQTGRHAERMRWTYLIGERDAADVVREDRLIGISQHQPLEAITCGIGSINLLDIGLGELRPSVSVLRAPTAASSQLRADLLMLTPESRKFQAMVMFTPPVRGPGTLALRIDYRWPGLFASLRGAEQVSDATFGFRSFNAQGTVRFVSRRPLVLDVEAQRGRVSSVRREAGGLVGVEYAEADPERMRMHVSWGARSKTEAASGAAPSRSRGQS